MNIYGDQIQRVLAIVVTYFPDSFFESRIRKLIDQFEEVLIIDNTPSEELHVSLQSLSNLANLSLLQLKRNMGIAYALNEGLSYAKDHGYLWVGTFDQDSTVPDDYLNKIISTFKNFPQKDKVAILSPIYLLPDGSKKSFSSGKKKSIELRNVDFTMTSGNILNVSKAKYVGGFDSSLFIDYVDFDLCLRLRAQGFLILENRNVILQHELGRNFLHRNFLWKKIGLPNYPPIRIYFSTRNRLILYWRYWKTAPGFVIHDMSRFFITFIKIILFESEKKSKIHAFCVGFRDGIFCRFEVKSNG
jgi:rhamnosyltransferase